MLTERTNCLLRGALFYVHCLLYLYLLHCVKGSVEELKINVQAYVSAILSLSKSVLINRAYP